MKIPTLTLTGLAVSLLCGPAAQAASATPAGVVHRALRLAQNAPDGSSPAAPDVVGPSSPGSTPGAAGGTASGSGLPGPQSPATPLAPPTSVPSGTARNNAGALPSLAQPDVDGSAPASPGISYGAPQPGGTPVYGATTRDPASLSSGNLSPSGMPLPIGGPINGTANAYDIPPGSTYGGSGIGTGRNGGGRSGQGNNLPLQGGTSINNLQPLGGLPTTRDQLGTTGGIGGYSQQGVYNGTAVPSGGNGYGPDSSYATVGRPTGGLLSTNVDATGPLRPYIPLNTGPLGRPNSGYGIPNGSRPTHTDGRGVQRID